MIGRRQTSVSSALALGLFTSLALGLCFAVPSNAGKPATSQSASVGSSSKLASSHSVKPTDSAAATQSASSSSSSTPVSSLVAKPSAGGRLAAAASVSGAMPSLVSLPVLGASSAPAGAAAELDTFDGKNPFADDSLWQIPVQLVQDLAASGNREPANGGLSRAASAPEGRKLASSVPSGFYSDNEAADEADLEGGMPPAMSAALGANSAASPVGSGPGAGSQSAIATQSSSSAPTVISASTDLKAAAGYHYPTHGYGHESHAPAYGHESHSPSYGHQGPAHAGYEGHESHAPAHYGGKYFQYSSVPYPYTWDFGYRRGNPYHTIERYEHGKGPHFQTKVKWADKYGGYGVHVWDYNHDDHHGHHYGGHYGGHQGGHQAAPEHYGPPAHHGSPYGHH